MIKLLLDDIRQPQQAFEYTKNLIYLEEGWVVVKSYKEFVDWITSNGVPDLISFDHDLAVEHYIDLVSNGMSKRKARQLKPLEKTGYDCAKWLIEYCMNNNKSLPNYLVHSMNPVGKENIIQLLTNYNKHDRIS